MSEESLLALVARRGRKLGLRGADLDDAVQEVTPTVLAFKYDASRSNGATRVTALTAVVDRCLRAVLRKEARYQKHLRGAIEERQTHFDLPDGPRDPYYEADLALVIDVQTAVAELSPQDQAICAALGAGCSIDEIATRLDCHWQTVKRRVAHLREHFIRLGLGEG